MANQIGRTTEKVNIYAHYNAHQKIKSLTVNHDLLVQKLLQEDNANRQKHDEVNVTLP